MIIYCGRQIAAPSFYNDFFVVGDGFTVMKKCLAANRSSNIAKLLNTHTTQYRRWETGESEIPVHKLIELCKYYNVSADYILGIKNKNI